MTMAIKTVVRMSQRLQFTHTLSTRTTHLALNIRRDYHILWQNI